jgi:hypothetical protein
MRSPLSLSLDLSFFFGLFLVMPFGFDRKFVVGLLCECAWVCGYFFVRVSFFSPPTATSDARVPPKGTAATRRWLQSEIQSANITAGR